MMLPGRPMNVMDVRISWLWRACWGRVIARWLTAGVLLAAVSAAVSQTASSLPATPPTGAMEAPIAATPVAGNTLARHRARVIYRDGMLDVRADNSSLNQVLRDIARQTGMKIEGGVADQRIFGNYGPAAPAMVLQTLLDGTGSDMFLIETMDHVPAKLTLTPRAGGAAPPGPQSPIYDLTESEPELGSTTAPVAAHVPSAAVTGTPAKAPQPAPSALPPSDTPGLNSIAPPVNNVNGSPRNVSPTASTFPVTNSVPVDTLPTPSTTPSPNGIVDAPNPPPPGTTTSGITGGTPNTNPNAGSGPAGATSTPTTTTTSPNGVKTPQQIYEELRQLQQQKSKQQQNSTPQ